MVSRIKFPVAFVAALSFQRCSNALLHYRMYNDRDLSLVTASANTADERASVMRMLEKSMLRAETCYLLRTLRRGCRRRLTPFGNQGFPTPCCWMRMGEFCSRNLAA